MDFMVPHCNEYYLISRTCIDGIIIFKHNTNNKHNFDINNKLYKARTSHLWSENVSCSMLLYVNKVRCGRPVSASPGSTADSHTLRCGKLQRYKILSVQDGTRT